MVSSGMAEFGYQYVDIDDSWLAKPGVAEHELGGEPRDAEGAIRAARQFPDMKALTECIHSKGLKAGIYRSPGPLTCENCENLEGSYQHELTDAPEVCGVELRPAEIRLVLLSERGQR